jgi:hypothetical protein
MLAPQGRMQYAPTRNEARFHICRGAMLAPQGRMQYAPTINPNQAQFNLPP